MTGLGVSLAGARIDPPLAMLDAPCQGGFHELSRYRDAVPQGFAINGFPASLARSAVFSGKLRPIISSLPVAGST